MTEETDPTLKAARDLREIVYLANSLEDQAEHKAADKDLPGGKAMLELAPATTLTAVDDQLEAAEHWNAAHYGEPGQIDLSHVDDMGLDVVALTDLLFWSEDWRDRTGSTMPKRPTIQSEANWLASALTWAVDNEIHLSDFVKAMSDVRTSLENTLYAGNRAERTRVPCIDCNARLIKVYADKAKYDHWRCPNKKCDRTRYERDEFNQARANQLHSKGADRFILVPDAVAAVKPRPEHTVRTWINRMLVRKVCDLETRQVMVWWPDVRDLHEAAKRRKAKKGRAA